MRHGILYMIVVILGLFSLPARAQETTSPPSGDNPPAPQDQPAPVESLNLSRDPVDYEVLGDSTIILKGNQDDLKILEALIHKIDAEIERPVIRYTRLENASAKDLAQRLQQLYQAVAATNRPQDKIMIVADEGSNSLLIAAPAALINDIIATAKELDQIPRLSKIEPDIIQLKYIPASEAAEIIKNFMSKLQQRVGGAKALEQISIEPNDRNNTLIITAPREDIEQIKKFVATFDVEPSGLAKAELLFIPLINARAEDLAKSLSSMMSAQSKEAKELKEKILRLRFTKVTPDGKQEVLPELDLEKPLLIIPEPGTNALLIATHDQNKEPITEIVKLLDSVPTAPEMGIEFFPLKYADSESVVKTLEEMFKEGKQLPKVPDKEIKGAVAEGVPGKAFAYNVGLHADTRTNTVVVSGRPEQIAIAHTVIKTLDVEDGLFLPTPRIFYLEHTDAERVAKVLTDLNKQTVDNLEKRKAGTVAIEQQKATILSDARSNALIISATADKFKELTELAAKLDGTPDKFLNEIRVINCDKTNAADLEQKIVKMWDRKKQLRARENLPQDLPVIVSDQRSNSLVVASNVEDFEAIKKIVAQLESQPLAPLAMVRMIEINNNDAGQLGDLIKKIFDERLKQRPGTGGQENNADRVAVASDGATNTLLVASSLENFEEISRIVQQLDIIPELEGVVQTFILKNADASSVANKINELIKQGLYKPGMTGTSSGVSKEREKVAIIADARANAIMVSASKPNMSIVADLVERLDVRLDLNQQLRIFNLEKAKADQAAKLLTDLFKSPIGGKGDTGMVGAVAIQPVTWTNSLLVWAAPGQMEDIEQMILKLDGNLPTREMMFDVIQLKQAKVKDLTDALRKASLIQGEGGGSKDTSGTSAVILSFLEKMDNGQEVLRKLIRQDISVEPYEPTNSLLVMAPPDNMEMLKTLLFRIDSIPPLTAQIEVFSLKNASAETMIDMLQKVFESEKQGKSSGPEQTFVEGASLLQNLTFSSDQRTNSIIVAGNEEYLKKVGELIDKLDGEAADERVLSVYNINNTQAKDLAGAIEGFNKKEIDRLSAIEGKSSAYRKAEQTVTVQPYEGSNSVVMSMSPRFHQQYMDIVHQLDRAPDQVLIEVMFVQVSENDAFELGVEFAAQDLLFSEQAYTGKNGTIKGPDFDFVGGTDLGAAGSGKGFSFTMTGEDFNFLFHALQSNGHAKIISRPSIMVKNNEEGEIKIISEIPYLSSNSVGGNYTSNTVSTREAGITLNVKPSINPDGFVQLVVKPEVSSIGDSVQLGGGLSNPSINRTNLNTTITIKDGETVVIGGLIEASSTEGESKVPLLGDIPWVGQAFRSNNDTNRRQELLIVITASVITSPEDAYRMSVQQRDKGDMIPMDVKQSPYMNKLQVQPNEDVEIKNKEMLDKREPMETYGPTRRSYGPPSPSRASQISVQSPAKK